MIKYITENDKNGKARFYKVIDGKKKVTSRVEYEAHKDDVEEDVPEIDTTTTSAMVEEPTQFTLAGVDVAEGNSNGSEFTDSHIEVFEKDDQSKTEVLMDVGEFLLDFAKKIIKAAGSKNVEKTRLQKTKTGKRMLVNYRNLWFSRWLSEKTARLSLCDLWEQQTIPARQVTSLR